MRLIQCIFWIPIVQLLACSLPLLGGEPTGDTVANGDGETFSSTRAEIAVETDSGSSEQMPLQEAVPERTSYDVLVFGATPAGVSAAVNAGREGSSVVLIEESGHIGGMLSGGLCSGDFSTFEAVGGTFREFMARVESHYVRVYGPHSTQVKDCLRGALFEPKVARLIMAQMLAEQKNVRVLLRHSLDSISLVPSSDDRLRLASVRVRNPVTQQRIEYAAKVFVDASYEGDLMAAAGAKFRIGCESREEYGESLAPEQANPFVQAYNFRIVLSRNPQNSIPIPKPEQYDRTEFAPILDSFRDGQIASFSSPGPMPLFRMRLLPNDKAEFNDASSSLISLALKDENRDWPEGNREVRERIFSRYKSHSMGLLWFLSNDTEVPETIRTAARQWGLPRDEYEDYGHWTPQLYVREARRLIGEQVFVEKDTQAATHSVRVPAEIESVAIGDYPIRCHGVYNSETGMTVASFTKNVRPFQVPYRVMLPKEIDGLLVPVAVSASHVGFCALRTEPVWMALGQAAGLASAQSIRNSKELRNISVVRLQQRLHSHGAMTVYISDLAKIIHSPRPTWEENGTIPVRMIDFPPASPWFAAAQFFGSRGFFHVFEPPPRSDAARTTLTDHWRSAYPFHEFQAERKMTEDLARRWLDTAVNLKMHSFFDPAQVGASGLTRGEFLNKWMDYLQKNGAGLK